MVNSARLRALVVEDEWPARNYLVELLETSGLAHVVGAVGGVEEARQVLAGGAQDIAVDVAFVDIALGGAAAGESGLTLVRSMSSLTSAPIFVFATAYEEHALQAFDLGVVDYLLKPFSEERVVQCLRRVGQQLGHLKVEPTGPSRIVARRRRSLVFLETAELWAFEAADRLTFVHTPHGVFDVDLSLAAVEGSFGRAFVRVHRNWLVNSGHIKELERDGSETRLFVGASVADAGAETGRGVRVPVSRERAGAVREMLLANAAGLRR